MTDPLAPAAPAAAPATSAPAATPPAPAAAATPPAPPAAPAAAPAATPPAARPPNPHVARAQAQATTAQAAELATLRTQAEQGQAALAALATTVERDLAALPEAARNAIAAQVAADPLKRLEAINLLRAAGVNGPVAAPATTGPANAPPPAPATDPDVEAAKRADELQRAGAHNAYGAHLRNHAAAVARGRAKLAAAKPS